MLKMINWGYNCAIILIISVTSIFTIPQYADHYNVQRSADIACDSRSPIGKCVVSQLPKPLRLFNSLHFLLGGNKKDKGKQHNGGTPTSSSTSQTTSRDRIPSISVPPHRTTVGALPETTPKYNLEKDPEWNIIKNNLQKLENQSCGMSSININSESTWILPGDYPWLAILLYETTETDAELDIPCGGSLISDRYVLTSAYCLSNPEYKLSSVRLGEYNLEYYEKDCTDLDSNIIDIISIEACEGILPEDYEISEVTLHPEYVHDGKSTAPLHDIALIRLAREVEFTAKIQPICLPIGKLQNSWSDTNIGANLTIVGWGSTAVVPQKAVAPLADAVLCEESLKEVVKDGQLCVGDDPVENSCDVDIGVPLVLSNILESSAEPNEYTKKTRNIQVGVFSSTVCDVSKPQIFTSVEMHLPWILRTMKP